jgi:hypothetical protein
MIFTGPLRIVADFRVADRLVDFKVVETLRAMVAALALLAELQEADIDKSRFRLKNESENGWLVKMQKVTIAPRSILTIEDATSNSSDGIIT